MFTTLGKLVGDYAAISARRRLRMNELTQRLTSDHPVVMGGSDPSVGELRERVEEKGYILLKFTKTRGGTELGFALDQDATDASDADFAQASGHVHVEGDLVLNGDPVRCIADIDLATLKGTGRLVLVEEAAASA
jgi:Core binding factor beta subunit